MKKTCIVLFFFTLMHCIPRKYTHESFGRIRKLFQPVLTLHEAALQSTFPNFFWLLFCTYLRNLLFFRYKLSYSYFHTFLLLMRIRGPGPAVVASRDGVVGTLILESRERGIVCVPDELHPSNSIALTTTTINMYIFAYFL